jgi:hypothetical protein
MIKKIVLLLLLGVVFCNVYADDTQDLKNIYNNYLPDFQKMTPEASALGQYGTYQSSGYSGVPNISVPLFSISSSDFSMPFELCYDASGIKVDQQATYVGLGWNLIMGGSISQTICGMNDFHENIFNTYSTNNLDLLETVLPEIGYCQNYCITTNSSVAFPATVIPPSTCLPLEKDRKKCEILVDVSKGARVPDIFQASFCGHRVSFIIDTHRKVARIIENDATAYKIELKEYTGSYPRSIQITDDHGIKYVFTEAPIGSMEENASYNLSKIQNAAGQNLVEFSYSKVTYSLLQPYYETRGMRDESSNMPIASEDIYNTFIKLNYPGSLLHSIIEYYPETIVTAKETVTFTYGARDDIKKAKQIDEITVKSNNDNGTILHTVNFKYGNFTESSSDMALCNRYRYSEVYGHKRLKLTDVTVDEKKYSFDYNVNQQLPPRVSRQQDFWGYYNGQLNTNGLCASPECRFEDDGRLIGQEAVGPANRYASEDFCKIGVLNKITYPTGGYTKFDYEINHFNDTGEKYYYPSASSLLTRVKTVRTESCSSGYNGNGYDTTPNTKEFDVSQYVKVNITSNSPYYPSTDKYYKLCFSIVGKDSNGRTIFERYFTKYNDAEDIEVLCELPKGHYVLSSKFESVASGLIVGGSINVSFPVVYTEDPSFADISGKSVGGGLRIKTIENYDSNDVLLGYTRYKYYDGKLLIPTVRKEHIDMLYLLTAKATDPKYFVVPQALSCSFFFVTSKPTFLAICSLGSPHVGYTKVAKEEYDRNGQLVSYDTEKYNNDGYHNADYNIFSLNSEGLNGKLNESTTYSKDNVPMRKVTYSYETIGKIPALNDMVFFPCARCLDMSPGNSSLNVCYKYSLYSKTPICAMPSKITETNYAEGMAMKNLSTAYTYKISNYQPVSVRRTVGLDNNTCETSLIKYFYPEDNEVSNSNPACLTSKHCISEQVKAEEYKNGMHAGGYRNVYIQQANGLPCISKSYSITHSKNEIEELNISGYDDYGNIREYKKKDGTPVTIIWSYGHQVPVMEIIGKTYNEVTNISNDVTKLENATIATGIISMTESLHAALQTKGIMATAYEYSPWYTVSCIITPNGNKTKYSYDSYGRLEKVSDVYDNTLNKYSYNYSTK